MSLNHYRAEQGLPKALTDQTDDDLDIRLIEWQTDQDMQVTASSEASLSVAYQINCAGWRRYADSDPLQWREDYCCVFHSSVSIEGEGFVPAGTRWRGVNISFAAHRLGLLELAHDLFDYQGPWENSRSTDRNARQVQFPAPQIIRRIGREMLGCKLQGTARELLLRGKAYEMLGQLTAHMQKLTRFAGVSTAGRDLQRIERARLLLEQDPGRQWTIETLAQSVELNTRKLKEGFRQAYDSGVYGYLQNLRIERAALLLSQNLPVSEVAAAVGYASASHFAKVFRRYHGVNPQQYSVAHATEG